ncbi:MAG: 50S ribosome-binding GTPase [Candidatus Altiarchaeota archaeon]|nr:50S ribosome-binding GTPase [Candidatus Altiarchaeota archaeon]
MFKLPHVPSAEDLIDKALRKGSKTAKAARSTRAPIVKRMKRSEERRVDTAGRVIESDLRAIVKNFPSYDQLPDFHRRLLDIKIEKDRYKKSLGAVQWCLNNVSALRKETLRDIKIRGDSKQAKAFLGRAASMVKRISKDLEELTGIKRVLKEFPALEDAPTLVICGYPNVGKSTFMRNLTGSDVKIAGYPFTTQSILMGHKKIRYTKYLIIDSPGLLDRPMEERNKIELQAVLAIEELADVILYIIDPFMETGPQLSLLEEIRNKFDLRVYVAINKMDCADEKDVREVTDRLKDCTVYKISAKRKEDCEKVFEDIFTESI